MNRKDVIKTIDHLSETATYRNRKKEMIANINGKRFIFRFVGENDDEELITVFYNGMLIFADSVSVNRGALCLKQNGNVFVAKIMESYYS